jgi:hypothetical protein
MSVTFLNGEGNIDNFRTLFPTIRSVCPIVTAYGDPGDWALIQARILTGEDMIGRCLDTLYVEPGQPEYDLYFGHSVKRHNGASPVAETIVEDAKNGDLKAVVPVEHADTSSIIDMAEIDKWLTSAAKKDELAWLRRAERKYFDMVRCFRFFDGI